MCKTLEFPLYYYMCVECEGAGYGDVNEVSHMELQRSIDGRLKGWMLLYEVHSIGN